MSQKNHLQQSQIQNSSQSFCLNNLKPDNLIMQKALSHFPNFHPDTLQSLQGSSQDLNNFIERLVSVIPMPNNGSELQEALHKMRNIADHQEKTIQKNMVIVSQKEQILHDNENNDPVMDLRMNISNVNQTSFRNYKQNQVQNTKTETTNHVQKPLAENYKNKNNFIVKEEVVKIEVCQTLNSLDNNFNNLNFQQQHQCQQQMSNQTLLQKPSQQFMIKDEYETSTLMLDEIKQPNFLDGLNQSNGSSNQSHMINHHLNNNNIQNHNLGVNNNVYDFLRIENNNDFFNDDIIPGNNLNNHLSNNNSNHYQFFQEFDNFPHFPVNNYKKNYDNLLDDNYLNQEDRDFSAYLA